MSKNSKSKRISINSSNSGYSAGLGEISRAFSSDSIPINGTPNSQINGVSKIPRPPGQFPISPPSQLDSKSFGAFPSKLKAPQSTLRIGLNGVKKTSTSTTTLSSPKALNHTISPPNSLKLNLNIPIGSKVIAPRENLVGTLRFLGPTKFKEGIWAGIELDQEGTGKNDGSVMGEVYFSCKPKTGIFIESKSICLKEDFDARDIKPIMRRIERMTNGQRPASMYTLNSANKTTTGSQPISVTKNGSTERPLFKTRASHASDLEGNLLGSEHSPRARHLIFNQRLSPNSEELSTSLTELYNSNAPPEQIILTLNTQLVTLKKKNELLKVRLNHKRAQQQANHMLKTELVDKARQVVQNRKSSQNSQDHATLDLIKVVAEKEEKIRELTKNIDMLKVKPSESHQDLPDFDLIESEKAKLSEELKAKIGEVVELERSLTEIKQTLEDRESKVSELETKVVELQAVAEKTGTQPSSELANELETLKSVSATQISELRQKLEKTQENLDNALESKHELKVELEKIADLEEQLKSKVSQISELELTIQNLSELNKTLEEEGATSRELSHPLEAGSIQANDDLATLVEELKIKIETLELENSDLKEQMQDEDVVSAKEFNDLKYDKDSYIQTIEGLQVDKDGLLKQVSALNASLKSMKDSKADLDARVSEDSDNARQLQTKAEKLELQVRELEDELIQAKALNAKAEDGTLSADDIHSNLMRQLHQRNATIVDLEARINDLEIEKQNLTADYQACDAHLNEVYLELDKSQIEADTYQQNYEMLEKDYAELNTEYELLMEAINTDASKSQQENAVNEIKQYYEAARLESDRLLNAACDDLEAKEEEISDLKERQGELLDQIDRLNALLGSTSTNNDTNDVDVICFHCYGNHDPDSCPDPTNAQNGQDVFNDAGVGSYSFDESDLLGDSKDIDLLDDLNNPDLALLDDLNNSDMALLDELDNLSY